MILTMTGISYKTAPIEVREVLSFHKEEIADAYRLLLAKEEIFEVVILSTCNRVELYGIIKDGQENVLKNFMRDYHKYKGDLDSIVYQMTGADATRHLCMVASGLDSMVLGEPQIFGQVKDAYADAQKNNAANYAFDYLFAQVFSIVKKVRTKTHIGEKNISISYAVVKLASEIFIDIENRKVMILGAGEMGELTVRNLIGAGVKDVIVANRTFQRAVDIAERFNGVPVMIHEIDEYISNVDIIVSSISASEYCLNKQQLEAMHKRTQPLFLVDISVPRSIDPGVAELENVFLYNIDDLKAVTDSNSEARRKEAEKGNEIIESKINVIVEHLRSCDIIPTLISIRTKAEEIRKDGILKTIDMMKISDMERTLIDSMTKTMVNRILYHSEIKLREYSNALNPYKKDS